MINVKHYERFNPSVSYNRATATLLVGEDYEVDLAQCTTAAEVLDWIFQIRGKSWATPQILCDFVDAFETLSRCKFKTNAQGVLCPNGYSLWEVDWAQERLQAHRTNRKD